MEDEPVIKPRRARGTPFLKFRHRLALSIVGVGFVAHCISVYVYPLQLLYYTCFFSALHRIENFFLQAF